MSTESHDDPAGVREPAVGHPYGGLEKSSPGEGPPGEEELGGDDVPETMRGILPPGERERAGEPAGADDEGDERTRAAHR